MRTIQKVISIIIRLILVIGLAGILASLIFILGVAYMETKVEAYNNTAPERP
jgi:hypothetical protein